MGKKIKGDSVKRSPLMQRQSGLSFDNVTDEELIALTPDEESDRFLSRWLEVVRPFSTYPKVFSEEGIHDRSRERTLLEIKRYFKKFVLENNWTEQKYVLTINNIFETKVIFTEHTVEVHGKLHDSGNLLSQKRLRRR